MKTTKLEYEIKIEADNFKFWFATHMVRIAFANLAIVMLMASWKGKSLTKAIGKLNINQ